MSMVDGNDTIGQLQKVEATASSGQPCIETLGLAEVLLPVPTDLSMGSGQRRRV